MAYPVYSSRGFLCIHPGYAQTGILFNILEQSTFVGILSVALAIVIIGGQMDLSIESTMALAAMLTAWVSSPSGLGWKADPGWLVVPATLLLALTLGQWSDCLIHGLS